MKRWRDQGASDPNADRDVAAHGPLKVESLGPPARGLKVGLPIFIGLVLVITFTAFVGKYVDRLISGPLEETPAPARPSAIAWIDTTAAPAAVATASGSAGPSSSPGESLSPGPSSSPSRVRTIRIEAGASDRYWSRADENHFTVTLTNTEGGPIPLDPCPTYRMYILFPGAPEGPDRVLNCAAIGSVLAPGQSVTLDMIYSVTREDPKGLQTLAWKLVSPPGYQAFATITNIYIQK